MKTFDSHPLLSPSLLGKFLTVGAIGGFVDNVVLFGIVETFHVVPELSAVVSKECSILLMFVLNERWTYLAHRPADSSQRFSRLIKSHGVRIGGAAVGIFVLYVLRHYFGAWYLLANVLGIGVGFVFNYTFETLVTWRIRRSPRGDSA